MNYSNFSINEMNSRISFGSVSEQDITDYVIGWNQGPVFSQAYYSDGMIRVISRERVKYLHADKVRKYKMTAWDE